MANLTQQQAQDLWDNRFESTKVTCNGEYDCYRFASRLDGKNYYLHYHHSDEVISDTDDAATIESQVVADLQNVEYQGAEPTMTTEEI